MTIAVISHPDCRLHDMGEGQPEQPQRLDAIQNQMISSGMDFVVRHYDAPLVEKEHLLRVHDRDFVDDIFDRAPEEGIVELDYDTILMPATLAAARRAAGAVVLGVDLVMKREAGSVFCSVRPPGHHVERHRAMGFCFFNNIAVGAAYALSAYDLDRIAIVDFDVHHGNGTEDIFRNDPRVLFCSSFQDPFYPFTDYETCSDHIVNMPLKAGATGADFRAAFEVQCLPVLEAFKPQFLFISAGFDAHREDDISDLQLCEADYAWITGQLKEIAKRHGEGRIVSALEGGYALSALGRSTVAHLKALLGN